MQPLTDTTTIREGSSQTSLNYTLLEAWSCTAVACKWHGNTLLHAVPPTTPVMHSQQRLLTPPPRALRACDALCPRAN
jgi:hypothetical protein